MNHLSIESRLAILEAMLNGSRVATVVTDPQQNDNPIIYTNQTFETLTGYSREDVIGLNCRFLQGEDTNPAAIRQLKEAIANNEKTTVTLLNYRKDGTPFWNRLNIEPVTIEGRPYFIGTQTNVSTEEHQRVLLSEQEEEINRLLLPILPIRDGLAAVSLIGKMNDERFTILINKLSEFVQKNATQHVIIDISGVIWEDHPLVIKLKMIQDVMRLMGCNLYVTGLTPKAAIEIAGLQDLNGSIVTFSTVQLAIQFIENAPLKV